MKNRFKAGHMVIVRDSHKSFENKKKDMLYHDGRLWKKAIYIDRAGVGRHSYRVMEEDFNRDFCNYSWFEHCMFSPVATHFLSGDHVQVRDSKKESWQSALYVGRDDDLELREKIHIARPVAGGNRKAFKYCRYNLHDEKQAAEEYLAAMKELLEWEIEYKNRAKENIKDLREKIEDYKKILREIGVNKGKQGLLKPTIY